MACLPLSGLKVIYPGLPSHPEHERIKAMANAGLWFRRYAGD